MSSKITQFARLLATMILLAGCFAYLNMSELFWAEMDSSLGDLSEINVVTVCWPRIAFTYDGETWHLISANALVVNLAFFILTLFGSLLSVQRRLATCRYTLTCILAFVGTVAVYLGMQDWQRSISLQFAIYDLAKITVLSFVFIALYTLFEVCGNCFAISLEEQTASGS
jgi:hypothetical protein